jgi:hypothetical protein
VIAVRLARRLAAYIRFISRQAAALHGHPTGFTAIFEGVVHKIGNGIEQEVSIARNKHSLIYDSIEMRMLLFRGGIEQLHDLACNL